MVKVDEKRDYYADLELQPTCTLEEVKKQFKKLALLYHPDRNRGNELEAQARFQSIQSAHEVLTDPEQRNKYDAIRKRGSVSETFGRNTAANRGSNPYKANSDFPPPPRRTGPPRQPPNGAERYSSFTPPPRREPASARHDAQERTNNFNAWTYMHNTESQARPNMARNESTQYNRGNRRNVPPATNPYEESYGARPGPPPAARPVPPTPRKSGFDPSDPVGDERSAPSNYDRAHRPHMPEASMPPRSGPRPAAPTALRPDSTSNSGMDSPFVEGARMRTPYATQVDERTYFSNDPLRRSASTRNDVRTPNIPKDAGQTSEQKSSRARSASPPHKKSADTNGKSHDHSKAGAAPPHIVYSSGESNSTSEDEKPKERRKAQPGATWTNRNGAPPLQKGRSSDDSRTDTPNKDNVDGQRQQTRHTIFTFPVEPDTFTRTSEPLRTQSPGTINTNFHPSTEPIPFRGRSSDRNERPPTSSEAQAAKPMPPPPPSNPPSAVQTPTPPPGATGTFSADRWNFENWLPPLNNISPRASPTRQTPNSRRARGGTQRGTTSRIPGTAQNPYLLDEDEEPEEVKDREGASNLDGSDVKYDEAMDIDQTPPVPQVNSPANGDRRSSAFGGIPPPPPGPPPAAFHAPFAPGPPRTSRASHDYLIPPQSAPPLPDQRSPTQNVVHGAQNRYPFDAVPSPSGPPRSAPELTLPKPPRVPETPLLVGPTRENAFTHYMREVMDYLPKWNVFNASMTELMKKRADEQSELEKSCGNMIVDDWMKKIGKSPMTWATFKHRLAEDQRIRAHYNIACERHAGLIERFSTARDYAEDQFASFPWMMGRGERRSTDGSLSEY